MIEFEFTIIKVAYRSLNAGLQSEACRLVKEVLPRVRRPINPARHYRIDSSIWPFLLDLYAYMWVRGASVRARFRAQQLKVTTIDAKLTSNRPCLPVHLYEPVNFNVESQQPFPVIRRHRLPFCGPNAVNSKAEENFFSSDNLFVAIYAWTIQRMNEQGLPWGPRALTGPQNGIDLTTLIIKVEITLRRLLRFCNLWNLSKTNREIGWRG